MIARWRPAANALPSATTLMPRVYAAAVVFAVAVLPTGETVAQVRVRHGADGGSADAAVSADQWTKDEVAIFQAVLRRAVVYPSAPDGSRAPQAVVAAQTVNTEGPFDICGARTGNEHRVAVQDMCKRSSKQARLPPAVADGIDIQLVDSKIIDGFFQRRRRKHQPDGWSLFSAAYPGSYGFFSVSRPGFSEDGGEAAVYFEHACGSLCGGGYLYFLHREPDGSWRITARKGVWIS